MSDPLAGLKAALADRYVLERELGRGGMATVYLTHDLRHDRRVAVKVLRPEVTTAIGAERFLREIKVAARLQHPHILPLHDSGVAGDSLYYVMPYVAGETLRARLQRERQLPLAEVAWIARDVADALTYAHDHGVVHRDVKPENILLESGHAVLSDFGIARAIEAAATDRLTGSGVVVGTPGYMSPEQSTEGAPVDGRSDMYSLACVVYEMLGGDLPFQGFSPHAILARQALEPAPRLRTVRDTVPEAVERAVLRALARAPADRFATVAQFADALAEAAPPPGSQPLPADRPTPASPGAPPRKSIAVLPFVNLSADPENEYFSDGMTEELITALARVDGLRVASRTSTFALKRKEQDVRMLGRQLNVATVLEGSVRKAGSRLRIAAQLVDVTDGYDLWSEIYERDVADVFAIQEEISRAIVDTLRVRLATGQASTLVEPHTDNVQAYTAYLRARYFWRRKSANGLRKCIEYFEQAIAADPAYALAYAGLADTYISQGYVGFVPPSEAFPRARRAAERALVLDDTLAEAHTAAACVSMFYDWEWQRAERGFQRALALKPRYPVARFWYACYLAARGRPEDSVAEVLRAHELAPLSLITTANLGLALYFARRYDEAITQCRKVIEAEPAFFLAHTVLGLACAHRSLHADAVAAFQHAITFSGGIPYAVAGLGYVYALAGRREDAQQVLADLRERAAREYVSSFCYAMVHIGLLDTELALAALARACDERSNWLAYLKVWPILDPLRGDARFDGLLGQVGLG